MTKDRIKTHIVWVTLYAAFFSAVAFAGTPAIPETDRAGLSPVALDTQAPAVGVLPVVERADI